MSARGIVAGAMGLAILDAVLSHQNDATAVGGAFADVTRIVNDFISPTTPAFKAAAAKTTAATTAATTTPAYDSALTA